MSKPDKTETAGAAKPDPMDDEPTIVLLSVYFAGPAQVSGPLRGQVQIRAKIHGRPEPSYRITYLPRMRMVRVIDLAAAVRQDGESLIPLEHVVEMKRLLPAE